MKILGYRGISPISWAIKKQTRSDYSHVGAWLEDGSVIEAWAKGFFRGNVRMISTPFDGHSKGTEIDVFTVTQDYREELVEQYLVDQIGVKYDYTSVLRFVTRRDAPSDKNKKLFCSELVELAFESGGLALLRGNPSHHSPRDTLMSPYLKYERTLR